MESQGGYLEVPEVVIDGSEQFVGEFVNRSRPAVIKVIDDDDNDDGVVTLAVALFLLHGASSIVLQQGTTSKVLGMLAFGRKPINVCPTINACPGSLSLALDATATKNPSP